MPIRCPLCAALTPDQIRVDQFVPTAFADYYSCGKCAYVWSVQKHGSGTVIHVEMLPPETA